MMKLDGLLERIGMSAGLHAAGFVAHLAADLSERVTGLTSPLVRLYPEAAPAMARLQDVLNGYPTGGVWSSPDAPPHHPGLPLVGSAVDFLINPLRVLNDGYMEAGRLFTLNFGPQRVIVMLGPEHNKEVFEATDQVLGFGAYESMKKMFSPRTYFFADAKAYRTQQKVVLEGFKPGPMKRYVPAMIAETESFLSLLGRKGCRQFPQDVGPLIMYVAVRAFLGKEFRDRVGPEFFEVFRDFSGGLEMVLPRSLPLPRFSRSEKAKAWLHDRFMEAIQDRRGWPRDPQEDFLQGMVNDAGARGLDDEIVQEMMKFL